MSKGIGTQNQERDVDMTMYKMKLYLYFMKKVWADYRNNIMTSW